MEFWVIPSLSSPKFLISLIVFAFKITFKSLLNERKPLMKELFF